MVNPRRRKGRLIAGMGPDHIRGEQIMKAAIFHGANKPLTVEQIDIDEPRDHEVLVRTVATGVCHSDLHFAEGLWPHPAPAVLGHEGAGIVEKAGKGVSYVKPGDHVISCVSVFCGACDNCLSGRPHLCVNTAGNAARQGRQAPPLAEWQAHQLSGLSGHVRRENAPA